MEQNGYQKNRMDIDRTEQLSIEENSYQQKKVAIFVIQIMTYHRIEQLLKEQKSYQKNRKAIDRTEQL